MKEKENIEPIHGFQNHGYFEGYSNITGNVLVRCKSKNGREIGYEELHGSEDTNFYIR